MRTAPVATPSATVCYGQPAHRSLTTATPVGSGSGAPTGTAGSALPSQATTSLGASRPGSRTITPWQSNQAEHPGTSTPLAIGISGGTGGQRAAPPQAYTPRVPFGTPAHPLAASSRVGSVPRRADTVVARSPHRTVVTEPHKWAAVTTTGATGMATGTTSTSYAAWTSRGAVLPPQVVAAPVTPVPAVMSGDDIQKKFGELENFICDLQKEMASTKQELSHFTHLLKCLEARVQPPVAVDDSCTKNGFVPWHRSHIVNEAEVLLARQYVEAKADGQSVLADLAMLPTLTEQARLALPAVKEANLCGLVRSALGELERLARLACKSLESVSPERLHDLHSRANSVNDSRISTASTGICPGPSEPNETEADLNKTILKTESIPLGDELLQHSGLDITSHTDHALNGIVGDQPAWLGRQSSVPLPPLLTPIAGCCDLGPSAMLWREAALPSFRASPPKREVPTREVTLSPVRTVPRQMSPAHREATLSPVRTSPADREVH